MESDVNHVIVLALNVIYKLINALVAILVKYFLITLV